MEEIKRFLMENTDEKNAKFARGLINTKYKICGTKMKKLVDFARILVKEGKKPQFIHITYHEEILILGFMIALLKVDKKEKLKQLDKLLPFIDNWATCDSIIPRMTDLGSEKEYFISLLSRDEIYCQRAGIVWCKRFLLKEDVSGTISLLERVRSDDYYVNMALAWTYQEAFIYDFDFMYNYIKQIGNSFIKRKTISKCCDSLRLSKGQKEKLKELRA